MLKEFKLMNNFYLNVFDQLYVFIVNYLYNAEYTYTISLVCFFDVMSSYYNRFLLLFNHFCKSSPNSKYYFQLLKLNTTQCQ